VPRQENPLKGQAWGNPFSRVPRAWPEELGRSPDELPDVRIVFSGPDQSHQTTIFTQRQFAMTKSAQNPNTSPLTGAHPYAPPAAVTRPRNGEAADDALKIAGLDDPTGGGLSPKAYVPATPKPRKS
jgi:hypothetical protein